MNRCKGALLGLLASSSVGLACGSSRTVVTPGGREADDELPAVTGEPPPAAEARVCPNCVRPETAGTETSDFSGDSDVCWGERAAAPREGPEIDALNHLREVYSGTFEDSLRWRYHPEFDPDELSPYWRAAPSGYEPATRLRANVVLGESEYFVGHPTNALVDPAECSNWFRVPATVHLSTADGAIEAVATGAFETRPNVVKALRASANLADVVGTLELPLGPDRSFGGYVGFELAALTQGKRGSLDVAVWAVDAQADAGTGNTETASGPEYPLLANFPDDVCGNDPAFPAAIDEPHALLDGQSPAEFLADWKQVIASTPVEGVWRDCSRVSMSFDLGELLYFCAGSLEGYDEDPLFTFRTTGRITTADGRMDVPTARGTASVRGLYLSTPGPLEQIAAAEFASRGGVRGVDPRGSPWLTTFVDAAFNRESTSVHPIGHMRVDGLDCAGPSGCNAYVTREALDWPTDSPSAPYCP